MHKFSYWQEGLVFSIIFFFVMAIPCVLIAYLGSKLIYSLGQRPTNSEKSQMDMLMPLGVTMALSFGILIVFYKFFSD